MVKLKKIIISLIIIIIALIITILSIIYFNKGEVIYKIDELGSEGELYDFDTSLQYVTVRNDYYAVQTCVQKFYTYYTAIFDNEDDYYEVDIEEENEKLKSNNEEALYNILDKEYIDYKNITKNNISEKMDRVNNSVININQMYVCKKNVNVSVYIVQGRLREIQSGKISDFKLMLKLDALNKTFSVYLEDYIDRNYKDLKLGSEINIEVEESIYKNDTNVYDYSIIDDDTYVTDLLKKYKEEILFDLESAYNHLDEEYKQKRFIDFNDFKKFANDNIKKNITIKIDKYQKTQYDNYTEYVCVDEKGNYYIFNENTIMNYGMILDTYTVNLPDFIEKYDQGDEQVKVGMNIEKLIGAINLKDYKYVYNKLDKTFRNNKFQNFNTFSEFIENNFFDDNKINYKEFKNIDGVYTYTLEIIDINNIDNVKNFTLIMKLLEDRDFVMSFEIE